MEWVEAVKDVNYLAVLAAIVASFAVGMTWYSMEMFGKTWMKELGLKKKDMDDKEGMGRAMAHSALATFFSATALAALMLVTLTEGAVDGAIFGAVVGFAFAMSSMVTHDVFAKTSITLTRINGLHDVVKFAAMGLLIGVIN